MTRLSKDILDENGVIQWGYDYNIQVWVDDYLVLNCFHTHIHTECCNARKYAGRDIRTIEGHETKESRRETTDGMENKVK